MPPVKSHIPPSSGRLPDIFPGFTKPESTDKYPPLHEQFVHFLRASFLDQVGDPAERQATEETERLREKCRAGNPFPLIAHQWPFLVIPPESPDHAIFRENLSRIGEAKITDAMRAAILDPSNPVLRLDWWQHIVIAGFFDPTIGEISIKGCTGAGKGSSVSTANNLWFDVYHEARVHVSGRDFSHAVNNIFAEVMKWRRQMRHPYPARELGQSIEGNEKSHYIHIVNPSTTSATAGEAFSGAHGENTLWNFDESTSHPDSFFDNAAKNARTIIKLANPRTMAGRFRRDFEALEDINSIGIVPGTLRMRLCVTVGGPDCINVARERLKEPVGPKKGITINGTHYAEGTPIPADDFEHVKLLIPNQIDLAKFRSIMASPDKRVEVPVFGLGRFPDEDPESQVILSSWLHAHEQHWQKLVESGIRIPVTCVGLDVAASLDGDPSVLAAGSEVGIAGIHEKHIKSPKGVALWACGVCSKHFKVQLREGKLPVVVDCSGGYGGGVVENLREMGVWVIEFMGNATSDINPRMWGNLRAQSYATLGARLDPSGPFSEIPEDYDPETHGPLIHSNPWAIPLVANVGRGEKETVNDRLRRELVAPEKKYASDGIRFHIESKDDVKKKLNGQSPDYADAATMLWHGITVFRNLQSYFASYSGPLTVWPQPTAEQSEWLERDDAKRSAKLQRENAESIYAGFGIDVAKAGSYNDDSHGGDSSVGDGGSESGSAAVDGGGSGVSPTLEWLRQRYGDGGESERGGKFDRFFGE